MDETEKAVFDLVETYNGRSIFTFKRYPLKHNTDLNEDFRMDPLDACDLLEEFTEKFSINPDEINFTRYFPEDNGKAEKALTIQLLIDSARAGHWTDKEKSKRENTLPSNSDRKIMKKGTNKTIYILAVIICFLILPEIVVRTLTPEQLVRLSDFTSLGGIFSHLLSLMIFLGIASILLGIAAIYLAKKIYRYLVRLKK